MKTGNKSIVSLGKSGASKKKIKYPIEAYLQPCSAYFSLTVVYPNASKAPG